MNSCWRYVSSRTIELRAHEKGQKDADLETWMYLGNKVRWYTDLPYCTTLRAPHPTGGGVLTRKSLCARTKVLNILWPCDGNWSCWPVCQHKATKSLVWLFSHFDLLILTLHLVHFMEKHAERITFWSARETVSQVVRLDSLLHPC